MPAVCPPLNRFPAVRFWPATSGMALARGASSKDRLKAGLVGCGGRGTQAVVNLLTGNENVDLVAMADVFEDHLEGSLNRLRNNARYVSRDAGITVERNGKPVADERRGSRRLHPAAHQGRSGTSFRRLRFVPETDQFRRRHRDAGHAARLPAAALRSRHQCRQARVYRKAHRHRSGGRAAFHGRGQAGGREEAHRDVRRATPRRSASTSRRWTRFTTAPSATSWRSTPIT